MPAYAELAHEALESTRDALTREYESFKAKGLALNMARGKPSRAQLDLSMPMLACIVDVDDCTAEDGTDCRNYGVLGGIPEAKRLMAAMLDDDAEHVMVFGNSSLNIMYWAMSLAMTNGVMGSKPCGRQIIISTIKPPSISILYSLKSRISSRETTSRMAARMTANCEPIPPSTTIASTKADSAKVKDSGLTKP